MSDQTDERLDPVLAERFVRAERSLQAAPQAAAANQAFCSRLTQRVRQLRRWRRLQVGASVAAVTLGGALLLHARAAALAALGGAAAFSTGAGLLHTGAWLVGPAGWVCSLLLGAAALWRLRAPRR